MTACKELHVKIKKVSQQARINLPNGHTSDVSHSGDVKLANALALSNVMYVPAFKHDLISVQKHTQQQGCKVSFMPEYCTI